MGKRKSKLLQDDISDSDSDGDGPDDADDLYDGDDPDVAAERELFRGPQRGQKRRRAQRDEEGDVDDWGNPRRKDASVKRTDYTKGLSFVSAGGKSTVEPLDNLAPMHPLEGADATLAQAEEKQFEEEEADMQLDSDADSGSEEADEGDDDDDQDDDLAPVPGLAPSRSPTPPPPPPPETSLGFAPRGIGSARGRGRGGLGSSSTSRAGIGGGAPRAAMSFASATAASATVLGELGARPEGMKPSASGVDSPMAGAATPRTGLGAARPGLGNASGPGIGSFPPPKSLDTPPATPSASIDEPARERRSFLPTAPASKPPPKISKKEQQHFAKLASSGNLGLKMLEKMGWKNGAGLGKEEQGIVTPIGEGQKVRKKGAGLASGERSAGAIAEAARMRGEDPDEIEAKEKAGKKAARIAAAPKVSKDAWQQPRKKEAKPKVAYKTYEEIIADSGAAPEGVGMLVDLSGNALSSQSLSSLPAYGAGSADPTRLPELRHNLSLLTSNLSSSLAALAREGHGVTERRSYLTSEESRVRTAVEAQDVALARLQVIERAVERIKAVEKDMVGVMMAGGAQELGPEVLLRPFGDEFDELLSGFGDEYEKMRLDEVVVAAIAPVVRRLFQDWEPLSEPQLAVKELKGWRKHFLIDRDLETQQQNDEVSLYGSGHGGYSNGNGRSVPERSMTAYETMMWTIWLPRVRSAINNTWSPTSPSVAIKLFTTWTPLLPQFLRDNILDQLILPKVSKAIADWSPSSIKRGGAPLHAIVFPWLEHAGPRMDQLLDEAKRKVRAWLKGWKVSEGVPKDIDEWQHAFSKGDWDALLLKHVLPQLGATLRTFTVNPRNQKDLPDLDAVVAWHSLLRPAMTGQLLETGFFPQWLEALYIWLTTDQPNYDQIAVWYKWWKEYFPQEVVGLSAVNRGFRKGLDLMNQAMALGDDAKYRLKRPDLTPKPSSHSHKSSSKSKSLPSAPAPAPETDVSFRTIVEELAAAANLLFLGTGRTDDKGHSLFRVSETVDGKGGATVYLDDDVVFVQEGQAWKPVSVDEMIRRAKR